MSTAGHCRECGAAVLWFKTVNGTPIPLNPLPVKVAVLISVEDGVAVDVRQFRTIHFDTCRKTPARVRTRA